MPRQPRPRIEPEVSNIGTGLHGVVRTRVITGDCWLNRSGVTRAAFHRIAVTGRLL